MSKSDLVFIFSLITFQQVIDILFYKKVVVMKKILFTMVLAITLIISGCSLFGQKNTVDVITGTGVVDSEVMET
jgi:hypothetical protein